MEQTKQQRRYARIRSTVADIPPGTVASYGQIAEIAGVPRGARQVGYVLRHTPSSAELPWHRVLQASGSSAFDQNSRSFKIQEERLAAEGVIMRNGKVDMRRYRWQPNLDELLWKPNTAWDED